MKQSLSFFIGIILFITSVPAIAQQSFDIQEDSYVRSTSPTSNYGTDTVLISDGVAPDPDNGKYGEVVMLLKWDLSVIDSRAEVHFARLFFNSLDASSGPYYVYAQNSPWSENSVTWEDLDQGGTIIGTIPAFTFNYALNTSNILLNDDGVALVQGWVDGSIPNNGFIIRSSGTNNGIKMDSKESNVAPPRLSVGYSGETTLLELKARVIELEKLLAGVTRNNNNIHFSGVNVHIDNGLGATNGNPNNPESDSTTEVNGLGNLIVGYNEEFHNPALNDKSGSHNIVVGHGHTYSGLGGLVVGKYNLITGLYSSVAGGRGNTARGLFSSVSGGNANVAEGDLSSILGGDDNYTVGAYSAISGGRYNEARGPSSTVSGGTLNTATGDSSSVSGGSNNKANGTKSTISGGDNRTASGLYDWAAGSLFEDN